EPIQAGRCQVRHRVPKSERVSLMISSFRRTVSNGDAWMGVHEGPVVGSRRLAGVFPIPRESQDELSMTCFTCLPCTRAPLGPGFKRLSGTFGFLLGSFFRCWREVVAYTYEELRKNTIQELRDIAKGVQH